MTVVLRMIFVYILISKLVFQTLSQDTESQRSINNVTIYNLVKFFNIQVIKWAIYFNVQPINKVISL